MLLSEEVNSLSGHFTVLKVVDESGDLRVVVLDAQGWEFTGNIDEGIQPSIIGSALSDVLGTVPCDYLVTVDISISNVHHDTEVVASFGYARPGPASESVELRPIMDGLPRTADEVWALVEANHDLWRYAQAERSMVRRDRLQELSESEGWLLSNEEIDAGSTQGLVHQIKAGDIPRFVEEYAAIIGAIDLHREPKTLTLVAANEATSVDPGAMQIPNHKGAGLAISRTTVL